MLDVSSRNFEAEVLQSEKPVVVDFWAEWCGPCRMLAPVLKELETEMGDKVKFVKVNVDENIDLAQMYSIGSIPAIAVFKRGDVATMTVGYRPKQTLADEINKAL